MKRKRKSRKPPGCNPPVPPVDEGTPSGDPVIPKLDMPTMFRSLAQRRAASKTDRHRKFPTVLEVLAEPYLAARELGFDVLQQAVYRNFPENPQLVGCLLEYIKDQIAERDQERL